MESSKFQTFYSKNSLSCLQHLQSCITSSNLNGTEIKEACYMLIRELNQDAESHIHQDKLGQAEECYTLSLNSLETVANHGILNVLPLHDQATIWSNRSFVRCKQGKYCDALKDAEICIEIDPRYVKGYWRASQAQKALSECAKAAHLLMLALSRNVTNGEFVMVMPELAILVSQITSKDEFKKFEHLNIFTTSALDVWTQIVKSLSEHNEYGALAILTTGMCDSCHLSSTVVHGLASIPGLSFQFIDVGKMLKYLADKEGTKAWHLKLAEFMVKRGANILTVADTFMQPFLIAMTALSVEGELPSFMLLAWGKISPVDYDQKDNQLRTPFHILAQHVKYSKRTSEVIFRDLLANGCMTTEADVTGKFPHDYLPQEHTIHKRMKEAMLTPEAGLLNRLALMRKEGNKALTDNKYGRAIEIYNKALFIVTKFSSLCAEEAILNSNISAVHLKNEAYGDALMFAERSLQSAPQFCKGYFRKGQALSKMGKHTTASENFVIGFFQANDDALKYEFSLEIAKILPNIPGHILLHGIKAAISYNKEKLIEQLTQKGMWLQVSSLVQGPPYDENYGQGRVGIMVPFDASKVNFSTIFEAVDIRKFDASALVIKLLSNGASPASLASSKKETPFHAAVRFCLLTNDLRVLKYMLDKDIEKSIQSSKDFEDRTPLHTLCIESEKKKADVELCMKIVGLLVERKVDFHAKDKYQRSADDYVIGSRLKQHMKFVLSNLSKNARDKSSTGSENYGAWQELKEKGNKAYKSENYEEAHKLYSEAILQLEKEMQQPYYDAEIVNEEDGHQLAVLYGNRAECWNKQGDPKMFLIDAKKSVDADGSWYKGHWRVGKAFKQQGKGKNAIKAFYNTLKALKSSDGEEVAYQMFSDLVEAVYEQQDAQETYALKLKDVSNQLWSKVSYDFIVQQKWELAEFVFRNCAAPHFRLCNFDLSPFCMENKLDNQRWVCGLLLLFLNCGADHKTLKFHPGDTYFHATIRIIVLSGCNLVTRNKPIDDEAIQLLNFVMVKKVMSNKDTNIQDNTGNTVLHLLATLKGPDKMREFLANYILDHGVDVAITNLKRQQAIELVTTSDVIKNILQEYINKNKSIDKLRKQSSIGVQSKQQVKRPENQTDHSMKGKTQLCDACERRLEKASDWQKMGNNQEVISNLVQVVNCNKNAASYHKSLTDQTIQRIAVLLTNEAHDVPPSVFKLSAKKFKDVLTILANSGSWTQLEKLVAKFREKKGQHALPDFAKNMSLLNLVKDKDLIKQEAIRVNLINLLVDNGATIDANTSLSALKSAMKNSEWKVALKLLELGCDARGMTLTTGDTPYHAALQVALYMNPGNFLLMEKLKHLQDNKITAYPYLDLSCQDESGNTLLHIAAQAKFNQHSLHAVELLCQWDAQADIRNKDGKLAIQYLPSDKDRRAQYIKKSSMTDSTVSRAHTFVKMDNKPSEPTESKEIGGVRPKVLQRPTVGTTLSSIQLQRAQMESKLSALPDVNYNHLTHGDEEQDEDEEMEDNSEDDDKDNSRDEIIKYEIEGADIPVTDEASHETEQCTEDLDIEMKAFDNMTWDVECTEEVWSILRFKKEKVKGNKGKEKVESMPYYLKKIIVKNIQQLVSGDWKPHLQQHIGGTPDSLQLFRMTLPNGACILWELAIAFSPRLSESAETVLSEESESSAVRRGRIYSELIRVWSIVLKHSELQHVVHKIVSSHQRGKNCIIQKNLRVLNSSWSQQPSSSTRIPVLYVELDLAAEVIQDLQRRLFPPASARKNEFHVLKFYTFSTSLVSAVLNNTGTNVDFPFRVTDIEHAVINLKSMSPLLLLGRSGTGKTTCCVYRMWSMYLQYWEQAIICGSPCLPRGNYLPSVQEQDDMEHQEMKDMYVATAEASTETQDVSSAGNYGNENGNVEHENDSEDSSDESTEDSGVEYDHLHQLFVTKNPVLCSEVQKNFIKLCNGTEITQKQNVGQNTALPNTLQDVNDTSFPLFLTSRQLLLMLDASVEGVPFFPRDEDLALKVEIPGWGTQEDIFNIIPLEHDGFLDSDDDGEKNTSQTKRVKRVHNLGARPDLKVFNRRECTYEVFAYEVWPKITKKAEIDFHPSLVWTEIMSFIKGSYESLNTDKGYLNETDYIGIGRKRAPSFSGNRSQIYEMFLGYHRYKQQFSLFDEADLVYKVYCRLRTMTFQTWILHEIYVDETQDFTQAELALLVTLCSEPNKMFLTGDTAQSIMRGISFRFNDLRSLFFYVKKSAKKSERHMSTIKVPQKVHQLTHNYRSHTGILSLASSVLDILLELFPDSFDPLEKDQGMFVGPKPIIIESSSPEDLALLLTGSRRKTSHIEFGTHQAVLVVNERAKAELPEELGSGIVLTIFESKGLEFDDILIYNFFKDSQAKKEWRVVTDFLNKIVKTEQTHDNEDSLLEFDADVLAQSSRTRPLQFDPNQHKVLNSELKHLYTAITRARVNVWIFDEDGEKRAPMFDYFKVRRLVKCMGTEECENVNEAIMFADKSTAKEWRLAGDKYMLQKLYTVAAKCYRIAEEPNKERVALAYQTALEASRMRTTPRAMREKYFRAGAQFVECKDLHRAALCFQNAHEFLLSAVAFEKNGKFEEASVQYIRAQKANDASRCLEQVGIYGRAIRVLVDNDIFDRAIDCLHRYEMEVEKIKREGKIVPAVLIENKPSDVHSEANLCHRSANYHYNQGDMVKAIAAIKRSRNTDDQVIFLQEKGFWEELAVILEKEGKTEQAAQFMLRSGHSDKAIEYAQQGFHKSLTAFIYLVLARKSEIDKDKLEEKKNAERALMMYTELEDYNGQANARLILGALAQDKKLISAACRDFRKVKPQNKAGELESFSTLHIQSTMKDCQHLVKNISLGFHVLDVLLNPKTENSDKQQIYMSFYGMELDAVRDQVTWYPHQYPICRNFMDSSTAEKERKSVTLDKAAAVSALKKHIISKIEKWAQLVRKWIEDTKFSKLPCIKFQEDQTSCYPDCKYMHRSFGSGQEEIEALDLLIFEVELDNCLQTGMERLEKNKEEKFDTNISKMEESKWKSVEELLHFLLPPYPSSQRSQHEHTQEIVNKIQRSKSQTQIERYLLYLWRNPGRVGRGLSKNILKEQCKSTDWIVQACFFQSLLKLNIDVGAEVLELEKKLTSKSANWIRKSWKYALFVSRSQKDKSMLIEAVGTRFIQSFNHLTRSLQDPLEALFPFTKMISALGGRNKLSLMPKLDRLIFWTEFYVSLTWLFMAKVNHTAGNKASFYMSDLYLTNMHLISACVDVGNERPVSVQQLVVQHVLQKKDSNRIMERQSFIGNFLVGYNRYSLISQVSLLCQEEPPCFWLAERIIILSSLVLLNIPGQYFSDQYEVSIRRELFKLNVTKSMPARLASLITGLKSASNYSEVAAVVLNYFHQQGIHKLVSCQWLEQQICPMQHFETQLSDCSTMSFYDADIPALAEKTKMESERSQSSNKDTQLEDAEIPEELDEKDIERQEMKKAVTVEENRKKAAAKIIMRFLKVQVMQNRLQKKVFSTFELEKMFKPFAIKDSFCGVCGTELEQLETGSVGEGGRDKHFFSESHKENLKNFESYKELYSLKIHQPYQEIKKFLSAKEVMKKSQIYKDIEHYTSKVLNAVQDFESFWSDFLHFRKWLNRGNKETLHETFTALMHCYEENHKHIETAYKEYKNETGASHSRKSMNNELKEHMEESLVDVDSMLLPGTARGSRRKDNRAYRNRTHESWQKDLPPRFRKKQL